MTEAEFIARWHAEKGIYEAWGTYVKSEIENALVKNHNELRLGYFIKIPAVPRLKEDDSLLGKAFHRGKPYVDPYLEIEDKVESPRILRRLFSLRGLSHEQDKQVFTRGP